MTAQLPSSKEQLLADIAHAEEKAATLCGPCAADHARLAGYLRALLPAHEQEPVGEVIEMRGGLIMDGVINLDGRTYREISGLNKMKRMPLGTKFYTHPAPVPAVPDEWRSSLQELVKAMRDYEMDVDEPAPYKHREMMRRAEALLNGGKS